MQNIEKEQKLLEMANKALRNQLNAERNFLKKIFNYVFIFILFFIVLTAEKITDSFFKSLISVFVIFTLNVSVTRIIVLLSGRKR